MYTPDSWVKIKIEREGKPTELKILGGWSGGYLDGDSWRVNSGIAKEERGEDEKGSYTDYIGYSGSIYRCYEGNNRISMAISGTLSNLLQNDIEGITVTMEDLI